MSNLHYISSLRDFFQLYKAFITKMRLLTEPDSVNKSPPLTQASRLCLLKTIAPLLQREMKFDEVNPFACDNQNNHHLKSSFPSTYSYPFFISMILLSIIHYSSNKNKGFVIFSKFYYQYRISIFANLLYLCKIYIYGNCILPKMPK